MYLKTTMLTHYNRATTHIVSSTPHLVSFNNSSARFLGDHRLRYEQSRPVDFLLDFFADHIYSQLSCQLFVLLRIQMNGLKLMNYAREHHQLSQLQSYAVFFSSRYIHSIEVNFFCLLISSDSLTHTQLSVA